MCYIKKANRLLVKKGDFLKMNVKKRFIITLFIFLIFSTNFFIISANNEYAEKNNIYNISETNTEKNTEIKKEVEKTCWELFIKNVINKFLQNFVLSIFPTPTPAPTPIPTPTLIPTPTPTPPPTPVPIPKYSVHDKETQGKKIPILMYHDVSEETWGLENLFTKPEEFEKHLKYLKDNGFQTITFEDLDNISDFDKPILLTFDDGYVGNYLYAYPLLKKYNMKATVFIISDAVYSKTCLSIDQLKEMSDSGFWSIQSHTKTHYYMGQAVPGEKLKQELKESKERIQEITGKEVIALAYPNGEYNESILPYVKQEYKYGLLKNGGVFRCGDDLVKMKRMGIYRNTSFEAFKSIVNQ